MSPFYRLMWVVLLSGTIAGLVLFTLQHFAVVPLIEAAERYETPDHGAAGGEAHEHSHWMPAEGWERIGFTALTTILSAIGFAALLFGVLAFTGRHPNARQAALWGLAGFVCFHLAPALGLPPQPPGVALADVDQHQLWWIGTVVATAVGLWLIAAPAHGWRRRVLGVICLAIPHIVGVPAAVGPSQVPPDLVRRFALTSLATSAVFWPLLGAIGGLLNRRRTSSS